MTTQHQINLIAKFLPSGEHLALLPLHPAAQAQTLRAFSCPLASPAGCVLLPILPVSGTEGCDEGSLETVCISCDEGRTTPPADPRQLHRHGMMSTHPFMGSCASPVGFTKGIPAR